MGSLARDPISRSEKVVSSADRGKYCRARHPDHPALESNRGQGWNRGFADRQDLLHQHSRRASHRTALRVRIFPTQTIRRGSTWLEDTRISSVSRAQATVRSGVHPALSSALNFSAEACSRGA